MVQATCQKQTIPATTYVLLSYFIEVEHRLDMWVESEETFRKDLDSEKKADTKSRAYFLKRSCVDHLRMVYFNSRVKCK